MSKNISWTNINFVLRWQKIIPIIVLIKSNFKIEIKIILIISLIAIRLIVIKISSIKIIVVLSSIIHNRWILIPLIMIKFLRICYIAVYSAILSIINFFLIKNNIKKINSQRKNKSTKIEILVLMFSLAGIPPFIGFILKIIIILTMVKIIIRTWSLIIFLIIAIIRFFVYYQIYIKNIRDLKTMKKTKIKKRKKKKKRKKFKK